ncbi:MAG: preprotein translocase subunit SecG [Candidatus Aegiribacteria sp.]|nr:preprotein translocase subunit SecG [Candidatus Aegiribacteria sp.]
MIAILTIAHFVICVLLVAVVLLQKSKGDGLSGAFGGGGALTASFGNRGAATMLSKATSIFAVLFMATSFLLAIF